MNSAYDCIRVEHLELIGSVARLTQLFNTIPISGEIRITLQEKKKAMQAIAAEVMQAENELQSEIIHQLQVPAEAEPTAVGVLLTSSVWKEQKEAMAFMDTFQKALAKHFTNETELTFTGILMTMNTKALCAWVFKRIYEHGQIATMVENLNRMMREVELPVTKNWYAEAEDVFSTLRTNLLFHALEEDSKLGNLLRDNPTIAQCIKKLMEHRSALSS